MRHRHRDHDTPRESLIDRFCIILISDSASAGHNVYYRLDLVRVAANGVAKKGKGRTSHSRVANRSSVDPIIVRIKLSQCEDINFYTFHFLMADKK